MSAVMDHLLGQTRRQFWFIGRDLDRQLFDHEGFEKPLFELATAGRHSDIRFLIHDSVDAIRQHHAVHRLAQRLSSYIEVRIISDDFRSFNESFALFDQRAAIYRSQADRYDGLAECAHGNLAKMLGQQFQEIWNASKPDPNFRQIRL
ncbi:GCN5-related N-acetyltransferase [gamma proteobacterium HTCC5015]|nr:GCN5-related N-acetyltransferase [gamma proteobacterium HTCC5015]